jgi:hypothetical protein
MSHALSKLHARALVAALLLSTLHSLLLAAAFRFNNVDDAYISFRYGWNLVHGNGFVFNAGARVEGYTSFLWTLLLAPCTALPVDIVGFSIGLGLVAALAALLGLASLVRREAASGGDAWIYAVLPLVALDGSFAFWAVGGMETALFTSLVVWSVVVIERPRQRPIPVLAGVLLGLTTWTRPEGALLFALAVLLQLARGGVHARASVRNLTLGWALLVLPHLGWRRVYYGDWLPNTFHNKVSFEPAAFLKGLTYVGRFVTWRLGVPLLAVLAFARRASARRLSLGATFTMAYVAYVIAIGGDWPVANRFLVPVLPFVHFYVIRGLLAVLRRPAWRIAGIATVLVAVGTGTTWLGELHGMVQFNDNAGVETQRKQCGRWLLRHVPSSTVIAVGPAGAIPYYSQLPSIDMWGLTDPHIARVPRTGFAPGHDRIDLQYVLGRQPQLIIGMVGFRKYNPPAGYLDGSERIPAEFRPREIVLARPGVLP